jgi:hypothetical protein
MIALSAVLLLSAPASAAKSAKKQSGPPRCDRCSDLTQLQKELAQQEWLRHHFEEYLDWRLPPGAKGDKDDRSTIQRMQDFAQAEFNRWLNSAPGGGSGSGQAEAATQLDTCQLMLPVRDANGQNKKAKDGTLEMRVVKPSEIRAQYCPAVADMILTHEGQHQIDCRANKKLNPPRDMTNYRNFAAYDARGYSAGIASLKKSIAALAKKCGWKGTTAKKKQPIPQVPTDQRKDIEEDVIPTPQELDALAGTLAGGKK